MLFYKESIIVPLKDRVAILAGSVLTVESTEISLDLFNRYGLKKLICDEPAIPNCCEKVRRF